MADFVVPTVDRIPLEGGEWIDVKRELNVGDARRLFARKIKSMEPGKAVEFNAEEMGRASVLAYVVEWSWSRLGAAYRFSEDALDNMTQRRFIEIRKAVEAHEARVEAELSDRKNEPTGESGPKPISVSPDTSIGVTSGSVN
jgi:hypothetical protein